MNLDLTVTEFTIVIFVFKNSLRRFLKQFSGSILFLLSPGEPDELTV